MKTYSWFGDWRYGGLELFRSLELEGWPGRAGSWMHRCETGTWRWIPLIDWRPHRGSKNPEGSWFEAWGWKPEARSVKHESWI